MGLLTSLFYLAAKKISDKSQSEHATRQYAEYREELEQKPEIIIGHKIDELLLLSNKTIDKEAGLITKLNDDEIFEKVKTEVYHNTQDIDYEYLIHRKNEEFTDRRGEIHYYLNDIYNSCQPYIVGAMVCEEIINQELQPMQTFFYKQFIPLLYGDWNEFKKIRHPEARNQDSVITIMDK